MKPKIINKENNSLSEIGGKAKGLLFLQEQDLLTPNFYILDFKSLQIGIKSIGLEAFIENWKSERSIDKNGYWAIRSSAAAEDGESKSFAGQFKSILNVEYDNISQAVKEIIQSYGHKSEYVERSNSYGVIIQRMLFPDFSGVLFSKDPLKIYSNQPVITIIPGLGDKLVSGEFSGLHIDFKNKKPIFKDLTEEVEGERFDGYSSVKCTCSVADIERVLTPHLERIFNSTSQLEKIKNSALDFEFAIQDGIFYWLQVRPITTRKLSSEFLVWDNTSVEANYPGTTLPLSISFIQRTFFKAYGCGGRLLGFNSGVLKKNEALLKNMCGEIEGALYYNVTAWQSLLYLMPFGVKLSAKLPKLWGMEETPFNPPKVRHTYFDKFKILLRLILKFLNGSKLDKRYQNLHYSTMSSFSKTDLSLASFDDLKSKYKNIETELGDNWLAPVLNGFYTMIVFTLLKRKVENSRIYKNHPNFVNDILFSDGDVISVKLVRDFQELLTEISKNKELKTLFETCSEEEILIRLKHGFKSFYLELFEYINIYGNRTNQGELKMETTTYKQDPKLFIQYIKSNLKGFVPKKQIESALNYQKVIKENYPINFIQRILYAQLIKSVVKKMKTRENYRFMRTDTFAILRNIFLQMGEVLKEEGKIASVRDVFYLELDELVESINQSEFKGLISNRKLKYSESESKTRMNRYIQYENQFIPIENDDILLLGNQLKGTGCCSGVVESKVVFIDNNTNFNQDFSDCILIAHYFEPGWISLFYQAKGIISERGNLLSHTAIICRELNVPSIVGVKGLTKRVNNNDVITMDGATGIIKLRDDA